MSTNTALESLLTDIQTEQLRQRILALLLRENISLSAFAAQAGLRYPQVYQMLKGKQKPSDTLLISLLKAFPSVSLSWLVLGEGPLLSRADSPRQVPNLKPMLEAMVQKQDEIITLLKNLQKEEGSQHKPFDNE